MAEAQDLFPGCDGEEQVGARLGVDSQRKKTEKLNYFHLENSFCAHFQGKFVSTRFEGILTTCLYFWNRCRVRFHSL